MTKVVEILAVRQKLGKEMNRENHHVHYTVKKRLASFPSPAGMSITKLYSRPGRVWLITSRLGGNLITFFSVYLKISLKYVRNYFELIRTLTVCDFIILLKFMW
jgi:hypothetical protein